MPLTIHHDHELGPLNRFWRATGFANPRELLSPPCRAQLAMAAADPGPNLEHVRIHYLLDLVEADGLDRADPTYDWSKLDAAIDVLVGVGMKPFFELMGNPSGAFTDFNDADQLDAWRRVVTDLASHLASRYGRDEVRSWYFETWNEPDCDTWWKQFNHDPASLCKYYDACAAGLREADDRLILGGPGGCAGLSPTVLAFLDHCDHGRDYYTGELPRKPDFLSMHEKGAPMTEEHVDPDVTRILEAQLRFVDHIREHCPRLADVSVMNGEADPQIGWHLPHPWRATAYYAAFVVRLIQRQIEEILGQREVPLEMVINDNGFVGGWGNRTLTTLIGDPETERDDGFALLPKPVFHAMSLLNELGPTRLEHHWRPDEHETPGPGQVGAIATRRHDGRLAILVSRFTDAWRERQTGVVTVALPRLVSDGATARIRTIQDTDALDHAATLDPRDPRLLEPEPWERLQRATALNEHTVPLGQAGPDTPCLRVDLPLPSVVLIEIDPAHGPTASETNDSTHR